MTFTPTPKCPICREPLYEWRSNHKCDPKFYVWEEGNGDTFTDAYDSSTRHIFASNAEAAACEYFENDFERIEVEVYVLADNDAVQRILDELVECDQSEDAIAHWNQEAQKLAELYVVSAEMVRSVSAVKKERTP